MLREIPGTSKYTATLSHTCLLTQFGRDDRERR